MKIAYFNHNENNLPLEKIVMEVCNTSKWDFFHVKDGSSTVDWIQDSEIAIIHGIHRIEGTEQREYKYYYDILSKVDIPSKNGLVVIFVSSVPNSEAPLRIEFAIEENTQGGTRYLLPVRNTEEAGLALTATRFYGESDNYKAVVNQWTRLLKAVADKTNLEKWFQDPERDKFLNELFWEQDEEFLIALAVLCQGYLAVHSAMALASAGPIIVKRALSDMGLDKQILASDKAESLKERVIDRVWWRNVFDGDYDSVRSKIAKELKTTSVDSASYALAELLKAIYSPSELSIAITDDLVAKAYLDIANVLRAS